MGVLLVLGLVLEGHIRHTCATWIGLHYHKSRRKSGLHSARPWADEPMTCRRDFGKDAAFYAPFTIFGPSVSTTDGSDWKRQRKITTPPFNERNDGLVCDESRRQAEEMLETWLNKGVVTSTMEDVFYLLFVS
jgi:cytochrome P450